MKCSSKHDLLQIERLNKILVQLKRRDKEIRQQQKEVIRIALGEFEIFSKFICLKHLEESMIWLPEMSSNEQ